MHYNGWMTADISGTRYERRNMIASECVRFKRVSLGGEASRQGERNAVQRFFCLSVSAEVGAVLKKNNSAVAVVPSFFFPYAVAYTVCGAVVAAVKIFFNISVNTLAIQTRETLRIVNIIALLYISQNKSNKSSSYKGTFGINFFDIYCFCEYAVLQNTFNVTSVVVRIPHDFCAIHSSAVFSEIWRYAVVRLICFGVVPRCVLDLV